MTLSRRTLLKTGIGTALAGTALTGGCGMLSAHENTPAMTQDRRSRILASPHYVDGEFKPDVPHRMIHMDGSGWRKFLSPETGVQIPGSRWSVRWHKRARRRSGRTAR